MRLLAFILLAATACRPLPPRSGAWVDPSPHDVRLVAVAPDVRLEVLDWGGPGEPIVFLAGLGNSAHVFDDFAPHFRDCHRVLAVSRRGFGASTRSRDGYDATTRARDVVAVLDSLGIRRAVLAGHSLTGEEISTIAAEYPERVRALVYLDAYDYGEAFQRQRDQQPEIPELDPLRMTHADSASYAAVVEYRRRSGAVDYPEGELRAHHRFGRNGRLVKIVPRPHAEVARGLAGSDYMRISAPAVWAAWLYAALRAHYGRGIGTIAVAGVAWWIIVSMQSAKWLALSPVSPRDAILPALLTLPAIILSAMTAGWCYENFRWRRSDGTPDGGLP